MCHETILKFLDPARLAQILGIFQMDQWPKEYQFNLMKTDL